MCQRKGGQGGNVPPQILADQKEPPAGGGAPHYRVAPQIFIPWHIPELECKNCRGLRLEISVLAATQRQSFSTVAGGYVVKKGPKIVNVVCERPHRLHYANGSFFIIQLPLFFFKWNAFSVLFLFYWKVF